MAPLSPSTPTFRSYLCTLGAVLVLGTLAAYSLFQARLLIGGPSIELSAVPAVEQTDRSVTLAGYARNISRITLNGRPIYTDARGYFEEALVLENGYTVATLEARDRYGRITRVAQPFVYVPASLVPQS